MIITIGNTKGGVGNLRYGSHALRLIGDTLNFVNALLQLHA